MTCCGGGRIVVINCWAPPPVAHFRLLARTTHLAHARGHARSDARAHSQVGQHQVRPPSSPRATHRATRVRQDPAHKSGALWLPPHLPSQLASRLSILGIFHQILSPLAPSDGSRPSPPFSLPCTLYIPTLRPSPNLVLIARPSLFTPTARETAAAAAAAAPDLAIGEEEETR